MRLFLKRFCAGAGYGAVAYLIVLSLRIQSTVPTMLNTASILVISGLIGIASLVFNFELGYSISLLVHFAITCGLVTVMVWINHWHFDLITLIMVIVIYLIIWGLMRLNQGNDVNRINQRLNDRK